MPAADIGDTIFMYGITSIYFEGDLCPLPKFGYNRDGKKGRKQIVVGMLTNSSGPPLGVRVFKGNTKDRTTVLEQMSKIKTEFDVEQFIFVGDRGMVTGATRDELDILPESGIDYITGLTREEIMKLANDDSHPLQASLFDEEMAEVVDGDLRFVLCFNPLKCDEDKEIRLRFLSNTIEKLKSVKKNVDNGQYKKEKVIARRLYTWLNHWGMVRLIIQKDVSTTNEFTHPIRHWNETRVKGHVFMCMLAYLVIWQARNVFSEFLERDENTCMCEAGSLREIWESLDNGISIGNVSIAGVAKDQLSPIPLYQKRLLKAANATIGKQQKKRLKVTM